ncbi:MAG: hypothetical protein ACRYFU_00445, partial [Janthinobacterium lividum]
MTAEDAVLALGALILVSSGVGLVFVHSSNPLLKGLHRMGAALATAGTAAALTWASPGLPLLLPLADVCMVLALVLCNIADQLLVGDAAQVTAVSKCVLGIQVVLG